MTVLGKEILTLPRDDGSILSVSLGEFLVAIPVFAVFLFLMWDALKRNN